LTPPVQLTLENFNAIPRVREAVVSADGATVFLVVQTLAANRFEATLWRMPADGSDAPVRCDPSVTNPSHLSVLSDGTLLLVTPSGAGGGAADVVRIETDGATTRVLTVPGGIESMVVAADSASVVLRLWMFPDATNLADDARRGRQREDADASAILFDELETRSRNRELGPRQLRLVRFELHDPTQIVDVLPGRGAALVNTEQAISRDGATVVTTWWEAQPRGFRQSQVLAIDHAGARVVASGAQFGHPAISPDGRRVAIEKLHLGTPSRAERMSLWHVDLDTGDGTDLTGESPLWPELPFWSPHGNEVFFVADRRGRAPIFAVDIHTAQVRQVSDDATYLVPSVGPSGDVFGLRHTYDEVPHLVVFPLDGGDRLPLPTPHPRIGLVGRATELTWPSSDGVEIHGHLVLPEGAGEQAPAPLILWIHGQTRGWNAHNFWQWCPYLLAERGYAVLMANPARSTGYGPEMMQRGWGYWGDLVIDDLLTGVDAATSRPDIDADRVAAMGHSFGGHMANWLAGRTDRFRAIVSCAGSWAFDQLQATTDKPVHWEEEFGDPYADPSPWINNSPRLDVAAIDTPMLIVYGSRDYNVPISEGLRMWVDLKRHDVDAKFLLFPDEDHPLNRKPADVQVLYQTALAFMDHHVLGLPWRQPVLLG
jgi:dipeptidyl aminopeptidase/acylaminoacyl peptidase